MIKSLNVKGLNHRIDADLEFNEDLNIITGKNGSGKTTLLKLLWYLISGNLGQIIRGIPFQDVFFKTNSFSLNITQIGPDSIRVTSMFSGEKKRGGTGTVEEFEEKMLEELSRKIQNLTDGSLFFPTFRRLEGGFQAGGNTHLTVFDSSQLQESMSYLSEDLSVNDHRFIASVSTSDISELLTQKYTDISNEISERQSRLLLEISEKLQLSVGGEVNAEVSKAMPSVLTEIQELADERDRLRRPFLALSELTRNVLKYQAIQVVGQDAYGEMTKGITLRGGTDGITLEATKEAITSDKLSSGEKQMLSFLCYNAFSENKAIFIDEPELSLHVDWQRLLLPTLLEQSTGNQFFIATHSPFIYSKYPDKEIPLGEDRGAN